jgi:hypothetical protein
LCLPMGVSAMQAMGEANFSGGDGGNWVNPCSVIFPPNKDVL